MSGVLHRSRIAPATIAVLCIILGGLAFFLAKAQREARAGVTARFDARALIAERFTSSAFDSSSESAGTYAKEFLAGRVAGQQQLREYMRGSEAGQQFGVLYDARGKVLAAMPRRLAGQSLAGFRLVQERKSGYTTSIDIPGAGQGIEIYSRFRTPLGTRVIANAVTDASIQSLLQDYLGAVPGIPGAMAYVVTRDGIVVGGGGPSTKAGAPLRDENLRTALRSGSKGVYRSAGRGTATRFVVSPIPRSNLSIVLTAPQAAVLAFVDGANGTIAWVVYAGLALALGASAFLLIRSLERKRKVALMMERQEAREAVMREREAALARAEDLKSQFFALVSHELRTPLTSIRGYVDVIDDAKSHLPEGIRENIAVIRRNTIRLDRLVQDLLMLTEVEAGTFTTERTPVEMKTLVEACVEEWSPSAVSADIELTARFEAIPAFCGDPRRLAQLLDHLVSNAIKFTRGGGSVAIDVRGDDDCWCQIEVADTGDGIEEEELAHLFDRFYRAEGARREHVRGVGLGLAIVQAIVKSHGGEVHVRSRPGEGTRVTVRMPMQPTPKLSPGKVGQAFVAAGLV
jgi:signal transduction histidine kinase